MKKSNFLWFLSWLLSSSSAILFTMYIISKASHFTPAAMLLGSLIIIIFYEVVTYTQDYVFNDQNDDGVKFYGLYTGLLVKLFSKNNKNQKTHEEYKQKNSIDI